ncbi:MAG: hypothetical protein AB7K71_00345 [Polyangiaceae bacterium]
MRLTLDQYARVSQALALHRMAPDQVFAAEQITAEQWETLKAPLELRIAESDPESDLLSELSDASQRALLWLKRSLPPLDQDVAAWFGFLRAYSESAEPRVLLSRAGLTEVDLMTLHQFWAKQIEDADQRTRAAGAQAVVPEVRAEPPRYPVPSDPIGPINEARSLGGETNEEDIPVFGDLPDDD